MLSWRQQLLYQNNRVKIRFLVVGLIIFIVAATYLITGHEDPATEFTGPRRQQEFKEQLPGRITAANDALAKLRSHPLNKDIWVDGLVSEADTGREAWLFKVLSIGTETTSSYKRDQTGFAAGLEALATGKIPQETVYTHSFEVKLGYQGTVIKEEFASYTPNYGEIKNAFRSLQDGDWIEYIGKIRVYRDATWKLDPVEIRRKP